MSGLFYEKVFNESICLTNIHAACICLSLLTTAKLPRNYDDLTEKKF